MNSQYNFYAVKDADDVVTIKGFASDVPIDDFFTDVSRDIEFANPKGLKVIEIVWHGKLVWSHGTHENFDYRYCDVHGDLVWEGEFPEFAD